MGYNTKDIDNKDIKKYQKLPDFCALGVINMEVSNGDSLGNRTAILDNDSVSLAHFCASCEAGYRMTPLN